MGAVAPQALVPRLARKNVGFPDQPSPSRRFSADPSAKMRVIARYFESTFLRTLRSPPDSGAG
jgi:hypothetical protein